MVLLVPVYWALPRVAQNLFLLAGSYYFYASVHGYFLLLILASTLIDYAMALLIGRDPRHRWSYATVSIITNLGILGYFKYYNFFITEIEALLGAFGMDPAFARLDVILPVGISFYTFQTMSYTIDVAMGRLRPTKNLLDFALYVGFFAQLVAGPIERAGRLLPQFACKRRFSQKQFFGGCYLVLYGLAKKVVIADNVSVFVDVIFGLDHPPAALIVVGTIGFAFQIYADFSGYSDIARGSAKMLGIELMVNFNLPYVSRSPAEFWRRWHISLSEWIRDYLYIPLGGSRCSVGRRHLNLIVAMALSGLWHGASLNFVLWGLYHAVVLILFRTVIEPIKRIRWLPQRLASVPLWGVCTFLVFYGWLLFRVRDFDYLTQLHATLLNASQWSIGVLHALAVLSQIALFIVPLIIVELAQFAAGDTEVATRRHWAFQVAICSVLILVCIVFGVEDNAAFIYFQF